MNTKDILLKTLAESGENYVSGAVLAERLGVSRNAVWKAVKALESDGFTIDSATSKGYRISGENNRLSGELISAHLSTETMGRNIIVYDEVESTNTTAKELAHSGAVDGTVIVADRQNGGRGRLGRSFVSPSGTGIYMTAIIRPEFSIETASLITSAVSCAVAEAVEKQCGESTGIKWVNDIYMNGRKICGILTEASMGLEMKSLDYAVIGIGINVRKYDFGSELSSIVTDIESETGKKVDRNLLCAEVINGLERCIKGIESRDYLKEYRSREILTGNNISAFVNGTKIFGKAVGIDDNANLILKLPDGTEKHLVSGEASLCRIDSRLLAK